MENRCPKCSHKLQSTDFICPHCGHILGQSTAASAKAQRLATRKGMKFHWGIVLGVLLLTLLALGIFLMGGYELFPATASTEPSTTTQPASLVAYEIQVKNAANRGMGGIMIHMYRGEALIYSFEADKYGKATVILPQSDEYYVMLSNLPAPYHLTHKDAKFPFENGQQKLVLKLEKLDVAYTAKVIDEAGRPIEGVLMDFGIETLLTDAQGLCTYYREYLPSGLNIRVMYAPTGYYVEPGLIFFQDGSAEVEVVLKRIEDVKPDADQQIYTVSVIDEFGNPVVGQRIGIAHHDQLETTGYSTYTNGDGIATIVDEANGSFTVEILDLPDYYGTPYTFAPGSTHLQIQVEIHKSEFTYTIQFVNQIGAPVPGVTVQVYKADVSWQAVYTSDDNGVITFVSEEAEPGNLLFHVTDAPEDYPTDPRNRITYYFVNSRTRVVTVLHQTVITLLDDQGKPIVGAQLHLQSDTDSVKDQEGVTDENGQCVFVLPKYTAFSVSVVSVPDGYGHLFFPSVLIDNSQFDIIMEPFEQ